LNSTHLGNPSRRRLNLADSADLITGVAWDANVVATLKSELDIADLKDLATTLLCILASCLKDLIDEVVRDVEDGLCIVSEC